MVLGDCGDSGDGVVMAVTVVNVMEVVLDLFCYGDSNGGGGGFQIEARLVALCDLLSHINTKPAVT